MSLHNKMGGHYSQAYDSQLNDIVISMLEMAALVQQQLADALRAFVSGDKPLAQQVIDTDRHVNWYEVSIDEHCILLLARRQPAASDLRLVIVVLKVINDVERIGDLAESIAKQLLQENQQRPQAVQLADINNMGQRTVHMLREAIKSLENINAAEALAVLRMDRSVDEDYSRITRNSLNAMQDMPQAINTSLEILWVARALERIGDHVRNICQHSIFLSKGQNVSHSSDAEMQQLIDKGGKPA